VNSYCKHEFFLDPQTRSFQFPSDSNGSIDQKFILGLLRASGGRLNAEWQERILTTEGVCIDDNDPKLMNNLKEGLLKLGS